jgi:hypothetical protein
MKKFLVLAAVFAAVVSMAAIGSAAVVNVARGSYKSMGGFQYPETVTLSVTANLVGPSITLNKSQWNVRTGQNGSVIMIANGDSVQYAIGLINIGSDSASDIVITDTSAFDTVTGQTVQYIQGSATDQGTSIAGGQVTVLEYYDGFTWQTQPSATIPTNAKGIRWTIGVVPVSGAGTITFAVKVTTP